MSVVLLLSTYDLGAQPLALAAAAGALRGGGHEVLTCDLSVEGWPSEAVARADCLCCSVPMHTALRLGAEAARRARAEHPGLPVYFFGLYAEVARAAGLLEAGDEAFERDEERALLAACDRLGGPAAEGLTRAVGAVDRDGLPGLGSYARFALGDEERLVATVAASTGCNHRCRHCPVPVVYGGRSEVVEVEAVLADLTGLVGVGATHVHFADPDFLNRPQHARRLVAALHEAHPGLTFDATIKVSHLLRFETILAELAAAGLSFVVSAFESTADVVLAHLDKGHVGADLHAAVRLLRGVGVEPRPSFLPFTPWTTRQDLVELFNFVASHDLIDNVDPVQYGIRLLLPPRSLLLEEPDPVLAAALLPAGPGELGIPWRAADPLLDELAAALAARAEVAEEQLEPVGASYLALRELVFSALGTPDPGLPPLAVTPGPPAARRGHLTESWFCCAEPTTGQLGRLSVATTPVYLGTSIPMLRAR